LGVLSSSSVLAVAPLDAGPVQEPALLNRVCSFSAPVRGALMSTVSESRSNIASCTSVSTQTASDDQVVKFWDELSLVGLPDDIDIQALFEPTGHCWAHHRCAEWSLGVCQTEEQLSVNVDKAVVSGSTEAASCEFCHQKQEIALFVDASNDVHIVSTLEPLSNAVKRNVPRCTITPVLLEQAHFRISVTCPSFVQTILIRLLKDQRKKRIVQCATALETS
ncbi:PREDICTED: histone-lysine N-methyltransferase 2D, partial [Eurypyga helias]|uniref:histone-lysine N-methyltransferase 2D n=1 Tax=Eurypyga helias TaxID=54383 RepID=UPI000528CFFD